MQGPAHAVQLWLHTCLRSNIATLQPYTHVIGLHLLSCLLTISLLYTKCPPFCSHVCKWLACLTYTIARTVLTTYKCAYIYIHNITCNLRRAPTLGHMTSKGLRHLHKALTMSVQSFNAGQSSIPYGSVMSIMDSPKTGPTGLLLPMFLAIFEPYYTS